MTDDTRSFEITKCGCDCWYCPDCCERKGYNLRARLIPALEKFTGLMMLTLTIDPRLFASPRDAYFYVRDRRAISGLMRDLDRAGHLHSRRYFYVVEFQTNTEQAHFHILIDATRVPKTAIDAAWSKLRPKNAGPIAPNRPPFGMTRFSKRHFDGGAEHAARYATKYLVKTPKIGWPMWVLSLGGERRAPRYQTSRGFWGTPPKESNPSEKTREAVARSYADRLADCGTSSNVFEKAEWVDEATGEVEARRSWLARIGLDERLLRGLLPEDAKGRPRLLLNARSIPDCLRILKQATGETVRIISGEGAGGGRP